MIVQPTLIENALIVIGESAWVLSAAAQLRRLVKTRNTRGLSAPSQTLNAAGNIGWCTYFALNHLWFPFVTNIVVVTLTIAILGFTLANRKQFVRGLLTIAIVGPLTSFVLFHFPAQSGWLGMSYNWLAATPQLNSDRAQKKSQRAIRKRPLLRGWRHAFHIDLRPTYTLQSISSGLCPRSHILQRDNDLLLSPSQTWLNLRSDQLFSGVGVLK
jgi:hypothetical protein